jgi:hypothetical protein
LHSIAASGIDAFPESGSHNYGFLLRMNECCEVFMNHDLNNLSQYTGSVSLGAPGDPFREAPEGAEVSSFTLPGTGKIERGVRAYFEAETQCEANAKEREL